MSLKMARPAPRSSAPKGDQPITAAHVQQRFALHEPGLIEHPVAGRPQLLHPPPPQLRIPAERRLSSQSDQQSRPRSSEPIRQLYAASAGAAVT
jgi:hypothetical protein